VILLRISDFGLRIYCYDNSNETTPIVIHDQVVNDPRGIAPYASANPKSAIRNPQLEGFFS